MISSQITNSIINLRSDIPLPLPHKCQETLPSWRRSWHRHKRPSSLVRSSDQSDPILYPKRSRHLNPIPYTIAMTGYRFTALFVFRFPRWTNQQRLSPTSHIPWQKRRLPQLANNPFFYSAENPATDDCRCWFEGRHGRC